MYAFADAFLISSRRQLNYLRSQPVSPSLIPHINVAYLNAGLAVETALKALIAHDSDCRQYPAVHPSARLITYLTDARRGALEAFYEERQVDGGLESLCGLLVHCSTLGSVMRKFFPVRPTRTEILRLKPVYFLLIDVSLRSLTILGPYFGRSLFKRLFFL